MIKNLFSMIGKKLGQCFGGGIFSTIGSYIGGYSGKIIDNYLTNKWFPTQEISSYHITNYKNNFLLSVVAQYGTPIPLVFGQIRVPGKIIWVNTITEVSNSRIVKKIFSSKTQIKSNQYVTEPSYYLSFAMAICEGEIVDITKVWHGENIININQYNYRLYKGSEQQLPDCLINTKMNNNAPAYRDLAYIVFDELPLVDFKNTIPNLSFEVIRKAQFNFDSTVEEKTESVTIMPVFGEYIHDTKIQTKTDHALLEKNLYSKPINCHNTYNIADSIHNLNQLQNTFPNLKWFTHAVSWFGNSLDIKDCIIKPGVESSNDDISYSEEWKVANYNRLQAHKISKDNNNNPIYGGTTNDLSIIRYLKEIRSRKIKIMFYPMLFLDNSNTPFRDKLTGESCYVKDFFSRKQGYNEFILHYAHLVKDYIDCFIIGSELIGLTSINNNNSFPAVIELVNLAKLVKNIVGPEVKVSYAANWLEYHHTKGGWYNLDLLWSSPNIDFIGINAYFPITNSSKYNTPHIEIADLDTNKEDYNYNIPLDPQYNYKNIRYWWENKHVNPDGLKTVWQPKSKLIWFTEFGIPFINQPNSTINHLSNKNSATTSDLSIKTDFSIQRYYLKTFIDYWKNEEFIAQIFLYGWNTCPNPTYSQSNIIQKNNLLSNGYWINNKFGLLSLSSIILDLSKKCNINVNLINVESIDELIEGIVFSNQITALNAINTLRAIYFFDISYCCNQNKIHFIKRGYKEAINIDISNCIKINKNSYISQIEIPKELSLAKIDLFFINKTKNYNSDYIHINNQKKSYHSCARIRIPVSLTFNEAKNIGEIILKNAAIERQIIKFIICSSTIIHPCDFVILIYQGIKYHLRLVEIIYSNFKYEVTAIVDDIYIYSPTINSSNNLELSYNEKINYSFAVLDLPFFLNDSEAPYLAVYLHNNYSTMLYTKISSNLSNHWQTIAYLNPSYSIAKIIEFNQPKLANIFLIDYTSSIIVEADKLIPDSNIEWNLAIADQEIISFKNIEKIDTNLYKISYLIRGKFATEMFMDTHKKGQNFIILNKGLNSILINENIENQEFIFKALNQQKSIIYLNKATKIPPPFIKKIKIKDDSLYIEWVARNNDMYEWEYFTNYKKLKFKITLSSGKWIKDFFTNQSSIFINIKDYPISETPKVNIIAEEDKV